MHLLKKTDVVLKNAGDKHGLEVAMLPHPLVAVADATPATSPPTLICPPKPRVDPTISKPISSDM